MKINKTTDLYSKISEVIKNARQGVRKTVNTAMVNTFWTIGQIIVENEQSGDQRAEYCSINSSQFITQCVMN